MAIVKVLGDIRECDISVSVFVNTAFHLFLLFQISCDYHFLSHNLFRLYQYEIKQLHFSQPVLGRTAEPQKWVHIRIVYIQITTTH